MVINFSQSRMQSRTQSLVSINFACTVSEIHNTGHSQRLRSWEVIRAWFREKM
ncbi:hypothetical protein GW17_00059713 [Ensete ventricosum]|nr:hypothetical protein GW17_00059713 [Ensete ventricosum]